MRTILPNLSSNNLHPPNSTSQQVIFNIVDLIFLIRMTSVRMNGIVEVDHLVYSHLEICQISCLEDIRWKETHKQTASLEIAATVD